MPTQDLECKEAIVSALVGCERHLLNLHWGPKLLSRVGCEAFKRDPAHWRWVGGWMDGTTLFTHVLVAV
jgi:hypothetical protein